MSLQWMDIPSGSEGLYGRGTVGNANMLNGTPWVRVAGNPAIHGPVEDPDPLVSGVAFRVDDNGTNNPWAFNPTLAFPAPTRTPGISARFWYPAFGYRDGDRPLFGFSSASQTSGYCVRVELNGGITVLRRSSTTTYTTLGSIAAPVVTTNAWQHLSFTIDTDTGVWSVQREGVPLLSGTDDTPLAAEMYFAAFTARSAIAGEIHPYFKDLIIWDQSGSTNNTHPGPVSVYCLRPNADVSSGWSRSSGSADYDLIDETPPDDAGYIYANDTLPAPAIMGLETLSPDVVSVRGVMSVVRARKTDGGDGSLQVSLSPNAGVDWDDGADRAITTAFSYWSDISELSPDTAAAWTPIEVNNAEIKLNRTI